MGLLLLRKTAGKTLSDQGNEYNPGQHPSTNFHSNWTKKRRDFLCIIAIVTVKI